MILAVDVGYSETSAHIAGVLFETWDSDNYAKIITLDMENIAEYKAGNFYLREMPCILKLLEEIEADITCIIIDSYVFLGKDQHAGLGLHLWNHLPIKISIIGVAKSYFKDTPEKSG